MTYVALFTNTFSVATLISLSFSAAEVGVTSTLLGNSFFSIVVLVYHYHEPPLLIAGSVPTI